MSKIVVNDNGKNYLRPQVVGYFPNFLEGHVIEKSAGFYRVYLPVSHKEEDGYSNMWLLKSDEFDFVSE